MRVVRAIARAGQLLESESRGGTARLMHYRVPSGAFNPRSSKCIGSETNCTSLT